MRRVLAIAVLMAMMLAAGDPAMAQTPNLQMQLQPKIQIQPNLQPKILPRIQPPNRTLNLPLIKPSQALIIAQRMIPNSKGIDVKLLSGGNYVVTLRRNNQLQRVIIDGDTGAPH
jgi:hypothetical protein